MSEVLRFKRKKIIWEFVDVPRDEYIDATELSLDSPTMLDNLFDEVFAARDDDVEWDEVTLTPWAIDIYEDNGYVDTLWEE